MVPVGKPLVAPKTDNRVSLIGFSFSFSLLCFVFVFLLHLCLVPGHQHRSVTSRLFRTNKCH